MRRNGTSTEIKLCYMQAMDAIDLAEAARQVRAKSMLNGCSDEEIMAATGCTLLEVIDLRATRSVERRSSFEATAA